MLRARTAITTAVFATVSVTFADELVEVKDGDVVSAEVINSLISGINNATQGFEDEMELDGTWSCKTYDKDFDAGAGCVADGKLLYSKVGQFEFDGINGTYVYTGVDTPLGCRDIVNEAVNSGNFQVEAGYLIIDYGLYPTKKYSDTEFVWELQDGIPPGAFTICNKVDIPPAPANNLAATSVSNGIQLTWTDQSDNEDGFRVERRPPVSNASWSILQSLGADVVSFTDSSAAANETWQYRIFAFNSFGDSGTSSVIQHTLITSGG